MARIRNKSSDSPTAPKRDRARGPWAEGMDSKVSEKSPKAAGKSPKGKSPKNPANSPKPKGKSPKVKVNRAKATGDGTPSPPKSTKKKQKAKTPSPFRIPRLASTPMQKGETNSESDNDEAFYNFITHEVISLAGKKIDNGTTANSTKGQKTDACMHVKQIKTGESNTNMQHLFQSL